MRGTANQYNYKDMICDLEKKEGKRLGNYEVGILLVRSGVREGHAGG